MSIMISKIKGAIEQYAKPALFTLALLSITFGLSLLYIEQVFTLFNASLTFIGAVALIILFILNKKLGNKATDNTRAITLKGNSKRARFKRIAIVVGMVVGSLSFIGISHYFADNSTIRWDLTKNKQHTLSKNTIDYISALSVEIELTAFYVGIPPKYLQDLFKEYERLSKGLIRTEIIDPIEQISYAAKFGNVVNAQEHKVIVQSGSSRNDIDFTNEALSEEKLTNAIARSSRSLKQVYFLTGHGEYSLSNIDSTGLTTFKQLLADNNIHSKPLMLGIEQSIPADCDVLVIAGPQTELTAKEEALIVNYLKQGGDALFLIEHTLITTPDKPLTLQQQQQNPSLNSILNQWGLNVKSDIVVDLTNHVGDDVGSPATKNYQKHKAITEGLDYTFYIRPRSIEVLAERRSTIKLASIVSTASTEQSWAETNRTLAIEFDPVVDTAGPVPLSFVVLDKNVDPANSDKVLSDTRLIVFTDADFLTNVYIEQYSNAQMGLNVVNWLAEVDYQVFLSAKEVNVERLDLTSKQKRQVIVILFLLPFFFFIAGIAIWLKSKVS